MTISELIKKLKQLRERHGDIEVVCQTLTHKWPPDPVVRESGETKYILLDP